MSVEVMLCLASLGSEFFLFSTRVSVFQIKVANELTSK